MPLQRRVPKRGFTNVFRKHYQIVNLSDISRKGLEGEVSPLRLKEAGLIANPRLPVKILGDGDVERRCRERPDDKGQCVQQDRCGKD